MVGFLAFLSVILSIVHAIPVITADVVAKNLFTRKEMSQEAIFPMLNGEAPYFPYPETNGISLEIPEQCIIEQVQMIARHAERFPKAAKGEKLEIMWNKFKEMKGEFKGPLAIFNEYEYLVEDNIYLDQMTNSSNVDGSNPYMGSKTAQQLGNYIAVHYGELIGDSLPIFSSSAGRVYETAKNVIIGLQEELGFNVDVQLQIISEDQASGANSLTPRNSCKNYNSEFAKQVLGSVNDSQLKKIRERLMKKNSQLPLKLKNKDIKQLISWCAYEINIKGYSPVCDLFGDEDLVSYSYFSDMENFYNSGLGNPLAKSLGSVLLNASYQLLKESEHLENKVWLSFTHDTDIQHFVSAIGLFDDGAERFQGEQVSFQNIFKRGSWITPMGARLFTEKLRCRNSSFVRYILNDAVIPIPGCTSGPGLSCPFSELSSYIKNQTSKTNYVSHCEITEVSNKTELTFFWDYNDVDYSRTPINYKVSAILDKTE